MAIDPEEQVAELPLVQLISQNQQLLLENERLKLQVIQLKNIIIQLKDKLNINSSNSGLPTSREVYRIEKKSKPKSDRSPGAQIGHKYNSYQKKTPDINIDVIPDEETCICGNPLVLEEYTTYQKIEIPIIKPVVTEYKLHEKRCSACNKKYKSGLDDYKLLGKNAESIISALSEFFNNSKREVQGILSQIFNLNISLGLISNTERRISNTLESNYNKLVELVKASSYVHLDETSAKNKGDKHWCWVATNKSSTVFKIANSRGKTYAMLFQMRLKTLARRHFFIMEYFNKTPVLSHLS
ncbi:IS66 family transposase [Candidatus Tisiphia endosymbiont of Parasteatoda lunata]|uniref:IS66 family transposase n=1 Tax=Candidatus Tisiphia endosymbiont of Parasteatoda lunata TaxID=3066275 RepID=UPI00313D202B